jgi:hypothetical protein
MTVTPEPTQHVLVRIDNVYSDGHSSSKRFVVTAPNPVPTIADLDAWFEDKVFQHTGDGHGADNPDLGSCYTATILGATGDLKRFCGTQHEWVD